MQRMNIHYQKQRGRYIKCHCLHHHHRKNHFLMLLFILILCFQKKKESFCVCFLLFFLLSIFIYICISFVSIPLLISLSPLHIIDPVPPFHNKEKKTINLLSCRRHRLWINFSYYWIFIQSLWVMGYSVRTE